MIHLYTMIKHRMMMDRTPRHLTSGNRTSGHLTSGHLTSGHLTSRNLNSWSRLLLLLLVPMLFSACVPYVKYEDVASRLKRANRVNVDMEKRLKDSQLTGFQGDAQLQRAGARVESLEIQLAGVVQERDVLHQSNLALTQSLTDVPKVIISMEQFSPQIRTNPETGGLMLNNELLFAKGRSVLAKKGKQLIGELIALIQRDYPNRTIFIDGHTDNMPIKKSKNADNWELGAKRAHAVFLEFVTQGVDKSLISLTSNGWAKPVPGVDPNSEVGRAQCRRVEIRIGSAGK
ncbi:MAG: OmpA family protein [Planctomycetota bacterium]|nr:OmpA family protein [Planctomycetota bacterium]